MSSLGNQNQLQLSLASLGELLKVVMLLSNFNGFNSSPCPSEPRFMQKKGSPSRSPFWKEKDSKWFLLFSDLLHGSCCGLSQSSLMLCLFVCLFFFFKVFFKKKRKNKKNTKTVCVCIYWYLCTLDGLWNKVSQLRISCSLNEHLHAQINNVSFVACFMWFLWFGWSLNFHILNHSFWREGLEILRERHT